MRVRGWFVVIGRGRRSDVFSVEYRLFGFGVGIGVEYILGGYDISLLY